MVQTPIRPITLEHFLELPETKPASEYIDGQINQKPMPQSHHSIIQCKLSAELDILLERKGIATIFTELRCTFGDRSIVPDISVFENSRVPTNEEEDIDNNFTIAPDWTIEILSPGQRTARVIKNINHCLAHNSQMGWLIDPEDKLVMVVSIGQKIDVFDDLSVTLPVPKFAQHIKLTGSDIFGWTKKRKINTSP